MWYVLVIKKKKYAVFHVTMSRIYAKNASHKWLEIIRTFRYITWIKHIKTSISHMYLFQRRPQIRHFNRKSQQVSYEHTRYKSIIACNKNNILLTKTSNQTQSLHKNINILSNSKLEANLRSSKKYFYNVQASVLIISNKVFLNLPFVLARNMHLEGEKMMFGSS